MASTAITSLFRSESARAKHRFETADWHARSSGRSASASSSTTCGCKRVRAQRLEKRVPGGRASLWMCGSKSSCCTSACLVDHHQPELAETFFNSVTCKILHRTHFHNDFIFVRPAVSTEYIENERAGRQADLPRLLPAARESAARTLIRIIDQLPAAAPRSKTWSAIPATCWRQLQAATGAQVKPARQLSDPGAEQPVLSQQGRLRGGQDHQRLSTKCRSPCPSCTTSDGQLLIDAATVRRGRAADAVQLCARLLHGGHGGAERLTCSFCAA